MTIQPGCLELGDRVRDSSDGQVGDSRNTLDKFGPLSTSTPGRRSWNLARTFDQGPTGACAAAAWGHLLAAEPIFLEGLTWDFLLREVYWEAQRRDRWPGGEYPGAKPIIGGTSAESVAQILKSRGQIVDFRRVSEIESLALALMVNGPVVLDMLWFEGMRSPANPMTPTGRVLGRHCVTATGARLIADAHGTLDYRHSWVEVVNSRGQSWGDRGTGRISLHDLQSIWDTLEAYIVPADTLTKSAALVGRNP